MSNVIADLESACKLAAETTELQGGRKMTPRERDAFDVGFISGSTYGMSIARQELLKSVSNITRGRRQTEIKNETARADRAEKGMR